MDNWTNLNMTNLMIQDTDKTLIPIYQSFPPPRVANISNTEMCWREVKMDDERKNPVFCWLYHWDDNCLSFHCRRNTHTPDSSVKPSSGWWWWNIPGQVHLSSQTWQRRCVGGETGSSNSLTAATDSQTRQVLFTDHTEIDNTEETFWSDEPMMEI